MSILYFVYRIQHTAMKIKSLASGGCELTFYEK
jgi:hypothetical protein